MTRMTFQEAATVVKNSLDILDVVGRHVALKRAGRNYTGLCPFHKEKTPSFSVSAQKQMYKCFGCGEGGDALSFLMKLEGKTYGELIQELAADRGIDIQHDGRQPQVAKAETDLFLDLYRLAQTYYQDQLQHHAAARTYLEERGIATSCQLHFGLGYAPPGWENLVRHLTQQVPAVAQTPMLLEKGGLANIRSEGAGFYDRFRNRMIIPIHDDRGRVVAFGGRALDPEDHPKYLNSPETAIYVKSRVLYGYAQGKEAIRETRSAVLMEGYFDVISAHLAGVTQAVGVCGTALTEQHLKLLQRAGAETLYLCFDSDEAGQTAALRAIELVEHHILDQGITLKVVSLPGEKDPDDFLRAQGQEAFLACLQNAQDFLSFKFSKALAKVPHLDTSQGRIQAVQAIMPLLLAIRQPVIRHEYLKRMAEKLQLAEETLGLELKRLENQGDLYQNKKNYPPEAISFPQERYRGRKRNGFPSLRKRPENITVFRQNLSEKLPIEQKEHHLLDYLFINEECFELVRTMVSTLELQSPLAKALFEAIAALETQWQTVDDLVAQLSHRFHQEQDDPMLQFLAHRAMAVEALQESYQNPGRGLKSVDHREKLSRDIHDIVDRIRYLKERASLSELAQSGRQLEQQADDESALRVQQQLKEALQTKKQNKPQSAQTSLYSITTEKEQGV